MWPPREAFPIATLVRENFDVLDLAIALELSLDMFFSGCVFAPNFGWAHPDWTEGKKAVHTRCVK